MASSSGPSALLSSALLSSVSECSGVYCGACAASAGVRLAEKLY